MLYVEVRDALTNAMENGHYFEGMDCYSVAIDLVQYDSELEGYMLDQVCQAVEEVGPSLGLNLQYGS